MAYKTVLFLLIAGILTLQIEQTKEEKYWSGCSPPHSELLKDTIGDKCILADFNDISIKDLPTPTHCMVNQGNSSQYVSCEEWIEDGCQPIDKDKFSQLRMTLSFTETGTCKKAEPCKG